MNTTTVYPQIDLAATGERMKSLMKLNGLTVRHLQTACGFENPQAVYKWLSGKCLPTIDNFIILSILFKIGINDIVVYHCEGIDDRTA
ncbi:MAG: helix-turn-helix domain-containing protein [Lachnospiraceae bacterium]|nr:helix-turn-helix domain-containing protein [Lachnospiraceae bacterium]